MQQQDAAATARIESARLDGKLVMLGCGSIGQATLPLLSRHVAATGGLTVLSADERGRGVATGRGAQFIHCHLKPGSYQRDLRRHLAAGDLMLNLSVDVSSVDLVEWCADHGVLYVDTSIEPWPGVFDNPMISVRERTNFQTRERMLRLGRRLGAAAPTAAGSPCSSPPRASSCSPLSSFSVSAVTCCPGPTGWCAS